METGKMVAVVDTHTGGEPTRIVVGGAPFFSGKSVVEKWHDFLNNKSDFRKFLMQEPRGHGDMFGAIIIPASSPEAHCGVLFCDTGGSLPMCGHGSIGVSTALVNLGMVEVKEPETEVVLEAPAGIVRLKVTVKDGTAAGVTLKNVPAFVAVRDAVIDVPQVGAVKLDVAFGGSFFAIVDASQFGMKIKHDEAARMASLGIAIKDAANRQLSVSHPEKPSINSIMLTEFYHREEGCNTKNCVIFGEKSVDRSPCGTGTCAKLALLSAKKELKPNERFVHESITGSEFEAWFEPGPDIGGFESVIPYVSGKAFVTGFNWLMEQRNDNLLPGFLLGRDS